MKKILCVGYRQWAIDIYKNLRDEFRKFTFVVITTESEFDSFDLSSFSPDVILFYGWSSIISEKIIQEFDCWMLHPSALPKYRGGSPIQNQIIDGVISSSVTIFRMTSKVDSGDILASSHLDLTGSLSSIFSRISSIGFEKTKEILLKQPIPIRQDESEATYCKRRTPEQSEITLDEIMNKDSIYLYNKIRMLADPYPNAFIKTRDGRKLLIKSAEID